MKKILLILTFFVGFLYANELAWVDEQIKAIKPPRVGLSSKEIYSLKDPFIFLSKKKALKKKTKKQLKKNSKYSYKKRTRTRTYHFKLQAIMNKSALINNKWYKEGQFVNGYKIAKVHLNTVVLTRGSKKITLTTKSEKTNLKFNKK
jgi:ribosomal protein L20